MLISKSDALAWFEFFAQLPEDEPLSPRQQEIALATLSQIEVAEAARIDGLKSEVPGLKTLGGRSCYVGDDARFPKGCRSCLLGTGLSAVRKTKQRHDRGASFTILAVAEAPSPRRTPSSARRSWPRSGPIAPIRLFL